MMTVLIVMEIAITIKCNGKILLMMIPRNTIVCLSRYIYMYIMLAFSCIAIFRLCRRRRRPGIIKGDEIMVINGAIVSDLDMMYLESVLQEEQALCMMMRSSRVEPPELAGIMRVTDDMIDSLVCPPPPSDPPIMSEEMISGLIVPAPGWSEYMSTSINMCVVMSCRG